MLFNFQGSVLVSAPPRQEWNFFILPHRPTVCQALFSGASSSLSLTPSDSLFILPRPSPFVNTFFGKIMTTFLHVGLSMPEKVGLSRIWRGEHGRVARVTHSMAAVSPLYSSDARNFLFFFSRAVQPAFLQPFAQQKADGPNCNRASHHQKQLHTCPLLSIAAQ